MGKMILTNGYYAAEKGSWNWITDGSEKFRGNKNIAFWFADLPNLTNGYYMFYECQNLTSFSSDLSSLTDGQNMFYQCTNLASFSSDLPNLEIGGGSYAGMFLYCENLTSFECDLPKLTIGSYMFQGCISLTSFSGDLSALTNGDCMFGNSNYSCTKLDLASVQHIANTINTVSSGTIHIGMQTAIQGNADLETALAAIRAKGWTVNEMYTS